MSEQPDWADKKASELIAIARECWGTRAQAQERIVLELRLIHAEGIGEGIARLEHALTDPADAADSDPEPS